MASSPLTLWYNWLKWDRPAIVKIPQTLPYLVPPALSYLVPQVLSYLVPQALSYLVPQKSCCTFYHKPCRTWNNKPCRTGLLFIILPPAPISFIPAPGKNMIRHNPIIRLHKIMCPPYLFSSTVEKCCWSTGQNTQHWMPLSQHVLALSTQLREWNQRHHDEKIQLQ